MENELASIQQKLADLDREVLKLAGRRIELLQSWNQSLPSGAPETGGAPPLWEQVELSKQLASTPSNESRISTSLAEQLLRTLVSVTHCAANTQTQIAYLGPLYSYSFLAAVKYFSENSSLSPVSTIAAVFESIIRGQAAFGVVPIENSTDGRIVDTLTMFAKHPVKICGEVLLPIHHCLLSRTPKEEINEVYSKPQALSQCRYWLSQHLPDARIIEIASTTRAAQVAAEKHGAAAIASKEAGIHYGLNVVADCIEDNVNNMTRFAVIGSLTPKRTGNDKTSIMFQIPHQSGALAEAMQIFSNEKLNMTWIESFPIPGNASEYLFFIELEGHLEDASVSKAIAALSKKTLRIELLGSYPKGSV